ncbi:hypothetical protein GCM10023142_21420 [Anaerocolumna aminovalerica]
MNTVILFWKVQKIKKALIKSVATKKRENSIKMVGDGETGSKKLNTIYNSYGGFDVYKTAVFVKKAVQIFLK